MPRQKFSIPVDCFRRSDRLNLISDLSSRSSNASNTEASKVNRRNTSPQTERKRGIKRILINDDGQENIRAEAKNDVKKRPKRRSGDVDLVAGRTTDEENDEEKVIVRDESPATMTTDDEHEDTLVMPIEREIVLKNEVIKEEPRDKSPPRVEGVNDGRVMGRPLDAHVRYLLELKSCILHPYPRHTLFASDKRKPNSVSLRPRAVKKRMLDLMADGEVDGGEETNTNGEYVVDGVLFVDNEMVLINWQGYKFPTWEMKGVVKIKDADYNRRRKILDKVFSNMIVKENLSPLELCRLYPNMILSQTEDCGQYVKSPGILYVSGLLKREQQINDYIDDYYKEHFNTRGPTIIFVDATNFKDSSIPSFQYVMELEETEKAKEIIEDAVAKNKSCNCGETCNFRYICCALKSDSKLAYINKNTIGNATIHGQRAGDVSSDDDDGLDGRGIEKSYDCIDIYECGDTCECTPTTCQQRVLQRGHSHTLMVFRHHVKGWTVRAGNAIAKGNFVCEYAGQVMAEEEASRIDKMYLLGLDVRMKDKKKKHLIIDAQKKGNEGRFFAHSCEPNLFPLRIHFDIEGRPKRHVGLFASRNVKEGEELTFDYYADVSDLEDFHKKTLLAKFTCRCGSKNCRETAYQKMKRKTMK